MIKKLLAAVRRYRVLIIASVVAALWLAWGVHAWGNSWEFALIALAGVAVGVVLHGIYKDVAVDGLRALWSTQYDAMIGELSARNAEVARLISEMEDKETWLRKYEDELDLFDKMRRDLFAVRDAPGLHNSLDAAFLTYGHPEWSDEEVGQFVKERIGRGSPDNPFQQVVNRMADMWSALFRALETLETLETHTLAEAVEILRGRLPEGVDVEVAIGEWAHRSEIPPEELTDFTDEVIDAMEVDIRAALGLPLERDLGYVTFDSLQPEPDADDSATPVRTDDISHPDSLEA